MEFTPRFAPEPYDPHFPEVLRQPPDPATRSSWLDAYNALGPVSRAVFDATRAYNGIVAKDNERIARIAWGVHVAALAPVDTAPVWESLPDDVALGYLKATMEIRTLVFREGFTPMLMTAGRVDGVEPSMSFVGAVAGLALDGPEKSRG